VPNAKGKPARRDAFADLGGAGGAAQYFAPQNPVGVEDLAEAKSIAVDLLESNPYQPRTTFDAVALAELAADIKENGVLQPLLVRSHPDAKGRYQIVAGERRFRAATDAGLLEVPCIERAMDDATMERLALVENIQRTDLAPLDEAHAFQRLMERFDVSLRDLAVSVHKHHEYIAQRLRLIKDPRIEALVRDDKIKPSTAQELVRVKDEQEREAFIERADRGEHVSVQEVRATQGRKRQPATAEVSKISTDAAPAGSPPVVPPSAAPVALQGGSGGAIANETGTGTADVSAPPSVRLGARRLEEMTPRERARIGPRTLKATNTPEYAWQTTEYLKTMYALKEASVESWERAVAEADEHRIYDHIPPENPYGTLDALLVAEIGEDVRSVPIDPTAFASAARAYFTDEQRAALIEALRREP